MKKMMFLIMAMMVAGSCWSQENQKSAPEKMNPIAVAAAGPVDEALVKRVVAWCEENLAVSVPVLPATQDGGKILDEAGLKIAKTLKANDLGVVVLVWPSEDLKYHGVLRRDLKLAVVNVRAMKTEGVDDETFARRIERQVMRGIGMVAGLESCPNPLSALFPYSSIEELDQVGRNYDPPRLQEFQKIMTDQGVPLKDDSAFFMLR